MTKGERIKQKREQLGISQTELAKRIDTSKQNLYKYENDIITNIPSDKIEALAKELNTSPAYIMGWNEDSQIPHYNKLIDLYLKGIMFWSEDKLAKPQDTEVYRMHFADLLLDYKQLIERAVYASLNLDKYLSDNAASNESRQEPLSERQLKERYFRTELYHELNTLVQWINAFPLQLAMADEKISSNTSSPANTIDQFNK